MDFDLHALLLAIVAWSVATVVLWRIGKNNIPNWMKPAVVMRALVIVELAAFYTHEALNGPLSLDATTMWSRMISWTIIALFVIWLVGGIIGRKSVE